MKIGWSNFAAGRHVEGGGYSYFKGTDDCLFQEIEDAWDTRENGSGDACITEVCVVTLPVDEFYCPVVAIEDITSLDAQITKRRKGEESHIEVRANGQCRRARTVKVVLYSAKALEAEGEERSGDYDWEIISIMASPVEDEPMHPLTMARNQLGKAGGSQREYTSEEWAKAVWYWSQNVMKA